MSTKYKFRDQEKLYFVTFSVIYRIDVFSRKEWILWMFQRAGHKNPNNTKLQFWQQDNHPVELTSNLIVYQKRTYIHMNPVRAGIVLSPEEYVYSSAKNYAGDIDHILPVQFIE